MVTPRLARHVRARFADAEAILGRLRTWRIAYEDEPPSERLLAAVVFMADGDPGGLDRALELGEIDWRDLLVAAGLEHEDWPAILDQRLGP